MVSGEFMGELIGLVERIVQHFSRRRDHDRQTRNILNACLRRTERLGGDWGANGADFALDIERAFVSMSLLNLQSQRRLELSELLNRHDCLVIQGMPGGGKTTLIKYIMRMMTKAVLEPKKYSSLVADRFKCAPLFPFWVELSHCNDGVDFDQALVDSVLDLSLEYVKERLTRGNVLLLMDGLDEIVDLRQRELVLRQISRWSDQYSHRNNRFIVTTRGAGYNHRFLNSKSYELFNLQELTPEQQEEMVRRYYESWAPRQITSESEGSSWKTRAADLIERLQDPGLSRLKSNPLLLAQIIKLHFQGKALPAKRHELYYQCIHELVGRRLLEGFNLEHEIEKRFSLVGEIALMLHQQKNRETCSRAELEKVIAATLEQRYNQIIRPKEAGELLDEMVQHWGILVNRENSLSGQHCYAFANLSLQEYMAAYVIHRYQQDYWPLLKQHLNDPWWQEVIYLYTAMVPRAEEVWALDQVVSELIHQELPRSALPWIRAGRCLTNEDRCRSQWHTLIVNQLRDRSYGEQSETIEVLGVLCQIEPEGTEYVLQRLLGNEGPFYQQQILKLLGQLTDSNARQHLREVLTKRLKEDESLAYRVALAEALGQIEDLQPDRMVEIPGFPGRRLKKPFKIGRYPVTNKEYFRFVESRRGRSPVNWVNGTYPLGKANYPVTFVSFDDARNYCQWLNGQRSNVFYRLPTLEEWMIVAEEGEPGRLFPWGNRLHDQYAFNWRCSNPSTTPVGIYIRGNTRLGVSDLLGNVWEWTLTRRGSQYVLKGGAWDTMDLGEKGFQAERLALSSTGEENVGFRILQES